MAMSAFRSFANDNRANIATLAAVLMTVLMGFAALGVDLGKMFIDRRKAQSTVDLAAVAAASDINNAERAARATVSRNGYPASAPLTVELGVYSGDLAKPLGSRFVPGGAATANAARVSLATTTPLIFSRVINNADTFAIRTSATAAGASMATFAIGSRLLGVNNGLLNQILGATLGGSLSLTAMDYQSLANTQLDLFDFMNAAAVQAQVTGPTYSSLLGTKIKLSQVAAALSSTVTASYGGTSTAARALATIAAAVPGNAPKVMLGSLVDAGPYDTTPLGQKPQASVSVSSLDILAATAQIANGQNMISAGLNLSLPGIASVSLKMTVGERPVGTSWVTVGTAGAKVHTAQTRVLLMVQLLGSGSIASVTLPIYLEVASGTATLTAVNCNYANGSASGATLAVLPGVLDAWIAAVSDADMTNFSSAPNPPAATLARVLLLTVDGRAHATMSNMSATPVSFTAADVQNQTKKTVTTTGFTSSLTTKLLSDLSISIGGIGLGGGLLGPLVSGIIGNSTSVLDQLLAGSLAAVGVGLGQADVWVSNLRCGGGVLVN